MQKKIIFLLLFLVQILSLSAPWQAKDYNTTCFKIICQPHPQQGLPDRHQCKQIAYSKKKSWVHWPDLLKSSQTITCFLTSNTLLLFSPWACVYNLSASTCEHSKCHLNQNFLLVNFTQIDIYFIYALFDRDRCSLLYLVKLSLLCDAVLIMFTADAIFQFFKVISRWSVHYCTSRSWVPFPCGGPLQVPPLPKQRHAS